MLFFAFNAIIAYPQETGSIRGRLLDENSPVEFADVILTSAKDTTKTLQYTTSDSVGIFFLNQIPFDDYKLTAKFIGYKNFSKIITINNDNPNIDLGNIYMQNNSVTLGGVTVTGIQQKIIQKTPEGFVLNAAANITQSGGTATDLLRSTPTVNVDEDGNVTLRGQTPLILIDGRNSAFTNTDQIAASSVESIEIITNPSAKYDASAESGIINIKLKKNKLNGISGGITLGGGFGSKWRENASLFFSYKTEKWNLGIAYDNRFAKRTRTITANRTNFDLTDQHILDQNRNDNNYDRLQNLKFNVDFMPDNRNTVSFQAIGNLTAHDNDESLTSAWYSENNTLESKWNRRSLELERPYAVEGTLSYAHKYADERKNLSASVTVSYNKFKQNTDITSQTLDSLNQNIGDLYYGLTHNYQHTTIVNALFDYAIPIFSKGVLGFGYKGKFRFLRSDFLTADKNGENYVTVLSASDFFIFNEQVHAIYVQLNGFFGSKDNPRWRYTAGIRAEQVFNNGNSKTAGTSFKNNYINFFPAANIAYYRSADEFFKLSYAKRINYPRSNDLNPFLDITDSLNQHGGNPNLKPEIIHSVEFSYNRDWKNYSLTSSLFFRYIKDDIQMYSQLQPNGVNISRATNIGSAIRYGWENIFYMHPVHFYDATLSFSLFQQSVNGKVDGNTISNNGFSYYGKLINNFIWEKSKFQLSINYNSPRISAQGKSIAVFYADFGFQQQFGKNIRFGISITDIFNTSKYGTTTKTADYTSSRISKIDSRSVIFTFSYIFNTEFKGKIIENNYDE